MATIIPVSAGQTPVTTEALRRLTVLGGGAPVWDKLATMGLQQDGSAKVAVLTKVDVTGIKGSRYVAVGKVTFNVEARRIWRAASHAVYKYERHHPEIMVIIKIFLVSRNARVSVETDLADFEFPTEGDVRNFSGWRDLTELESFKVAGTGVSEANCSKIAEWGVLARFVIIPTSTSKVALYLQLIPKTREEVEATLVDAEGQQVILLEEPEIPAVLLMGNSVGVQGGAADLVPQCGLGNLAGDSGLGILPILLSTGGELENYPSHAEIQREMFIFLRRCLQPKPLEAKDWEAAFAAPIFPDLETPVLLWPAPPAIHHEPAQGRMSLFVY